LIRMLKGTQYKIADSNVEGIGSSIDKAQRMAAAKTGKEWENVIKRLFCLSFRYSPILLLFLLHYAGWNQTWSGDLAS